MTLNQILLTVLTAKVWRSVWILGLKRLTAQASLQALIHSININKKIPIKLCNTADSLNPTLHIQILQTDLIHFLKTREFGKRSKHVFFGDHSLTCNRPFARWRHFTTTTRILFVFLFIFKFCNPSEV